MFLMDSVAFRLVWDGENVTDDEEQLKLESLTMTVSLSVLHVVIISQHQTAMIIGFTERTRKVSEADAPPGADNFPIQINLATLRTAEREHPMNFRLQVSSSTAIVEPITQVSNPLYDAVFGTRNNVGEPIQVFFVLEALIDTLPPRTAFIRDDLRAEDEECFTIRVFPVDAPGRRELFSCNEDGYGEDNYFCQTEICIMDDDGRFVHSIA